MNKKTVTILICFSLNVNHLIAQPQVESFTINKGDGTMSATINAPANVTSGDLLVIGLMNEKGNGVTITPPAGWTSVLTTNNGSNCGITTFYKIANIPEPADYTFTFSTSQKWSAGISHIVYADPANPINISAGTTGNSGNVNAPSVTTASDNALILCLYTNKKNATYTPDLNTTEIYDEPQSSSPSNMLAIFVQGTAGVTGDKVASPSENEIWAGQQIVVNSNDPALPVELLYFNATTLNENVCLNWSTASETNNDYFTIEQSKDIENWEVVTEVAGAGSSNRKLTYRTCDVNPISGISYYRLKQTDYNGNYSYSGIIAMDYQAETPIKIFPNPAHNFIVLQINKELAPTDMVIKNPLGQVVMKQKIRSNSDKIYLNGLSKGTYIMEVLQNSKSIKAKWLVID